jgi:hypothetical protein
MSLPSCSPTAAPQPASPPRRFAVWPPFACIGVVFVALVWMAVLRLPLWRADKLDAAVVGALLRSASAREGLTVLDGLDRVFAPQTSGSVLFALVFLALLRRRAPSASCRCVARAAGSTDSRDVFAAVALRFAPAAPGWTARGSPAPAMAGNPSEPAYFPIRF